MRSTGSDDKKGEYKLFEEGEMSLERQDSLLLLLIPTELDSMKVAVLCMTLQN